jgi:hypothetical protein
MSERREERNERNETGERRERDEKRDERESERERGEKEAGRQTVSLYLTEPAPHRLKGANHTSEHVCCLVLPTFPTTAQSARNPEGRSLATIRLLAIERWNGAKTYNVLCAAKAGMSRPNRLASAGQTDRQERGREEGGRNGIEREIARALT